MTSLRDAWNGQAGNWVKWARTPGHDHWFWDHNWPAFERLLPAAGQVARVLEPGARFAIATLHPLRTADEVGGYLESRRYDVPIERDGLTLTFSSMHHSIEGYVAMLRGAGFNVEDLRELPVENDQTPDLLHVLARKP